MLKNLEDERNEDQYNRTSGGHCLGMMVVGGLGKRFSLSLLDCRRPANPTLGGRQYRNRLQPHLRRLHWFEKAASALFSADQFFAGAGACAH